MIFLLIISVALLAYANGANDSFKGVKSLYGSKTCGYRTAFTWATASTALGSISAIFLAGILLKNFSGEGSLTPHLLSIHMKASLIKLGKLA
jgi:PiT family inorganic phosphate transporter